jgi:hypothetical protein
VPQLALSLVRSRHTPEQLVSPVPQRDARMPAVHTWPAGAGAAARAAVGAVGLEVAAHARAVVEPGAAAHRRRRPRSTPALGQTRPHMPQLARSLVRSRHTPEQLLRPAPQLTTQVPRGADLARGAGALPQAPQWLRSVCTSRHTPSQSVSPPPQLTTQAPREHSCPRRTRGRRRRSWRGRSEVAADARAVVRARAAAHAGRRPRSRPGPRRRRGRRRRSWRGRSEVAAHAGAVVEARAAAHGAGAAGADLSAGTGRAAHAAVGEVGLRSRHTPLQMVGPRRSSPRRRRWCRPVRWGRFGPQAPQLARSVWRSRHTPAQLVVPGGAAQTRRRRASRSARGAGAAAHAAVGAVGLQVAAHAGAVVEPARRSSRCRRRGCRPARWGRPCRRRRSGCPGRSGGRGRRPSSSWCPRRSSRCTCRWSTPAPRRTRVPQAPQLVRGRSGGRGRRPSSWWCPRRSSPGTCRRSRPGRWGR